MGRRIDVKFKSIKIGTLGRFLLFLVFLFSSSKNVFAEHEADHRYIVSGYVRDETGLAIENVTVNLEHVGGKKKKVDTNGSGYYEVLFHLHNDSLGDEILVRVGELEKKIKIFFDPNDGIAFRGDTVDFGAKARETGIWTYLTWISLFVLLVALYIGFRQMKRKNKAAARQEKRKRKKK